MPKSGKLDSLILSVNRITDLDNLLHAPNLTNIDLDTNKLAKVPDAILSLDKLASLNLSNNDINGLPGIIGVKPSLKKIHLEGNPLKALPAKFRSVPTNVLKDYLKKKLEDADAEEEKELGGASLGARVDLWETLCREFFQAGSLDLRSKELETLNVKKLMELGDDLHAVDASRNKIESIEPEIGYLWELRSLVVCENRLRRVPAAVAELTKLTHLALHKNQLGALPSVVLESVSILDLGSNQFVAVPPCVAFWPKLRQLLMPFNRLREVECLACENFQKLETLDVSTNKVEALSNELPFYLANLNFLNLQNNELKKLPNGLGLIPTLKSINVDGNPIKLIRRAVLDKGTEAIRAYLRDRFNEATDAPAHRDRRAPPVEFEKSGLAPRRVQEEAKDVPVYLQPKAVHQMAPF